MDVRALNMTSKYGLPRKLAREFFTPCNAALSLAVLFNSGLIVGIKLQVAGEHCHCRWLLTDGSEQDTPNATYGENDLRNSFSRVPQPCNLMATRQELYVTVTRAEDVRSLGKIRDEVDLCWRKRRMSRRLSFPILRLNGTVP